MEMTGTKDISGVVKLAAGKPRLGAIGDSMQGRSEWRWWYQIEETCTFDRYLPHTWCCLRCYMYVGVLLRGSKILRCTRCMHVCCPMMCTRKIHIRQSWDKMCLSPGTVQCIDTGLPIC